MTAKHKAILSERYALASHIGQFDIIPRPVTEKRPWTPNVQADVIIDRVTDALFTNALFVSTSDAAAALKFNISALGHHLREASAQSVVLTATQILAREAGLNPADVTIQKDHDADLNGHGPTMYAVLPTLEAASQLKDHIGHVKFREPEMA